MSEKQRVLHLPLWQTISDSFKTSFWGLGSVVKAASVEAISLLGVLLLQGIVPGLTLLALGQLIRWVTSGEGFLTFPTLPVIFWSIALLIQMTAEPISLMIRGRLNEKVFTYVQLRVMQKANSLKGLTPFHDPKLHDEIHYLREDSRSKPMNFVYVLTSLGRESFAVMALAIVLGSIHVALPFLVLAASIPHAVATILLEKKGWDIGLFKSPQARRLSWLSSLALDPRSAKEMRLFGFGERLMKMFRRTAFFFHRKSAKERSRHVRFTIALSVPSAVMHIAIVATLILGVTRGVLKGNTLIVALPALVMIQTEIGQFMRSFGMLVPSLLFFGRFRSFLAYQEAKESPKKLKPPTTFQTIVFDQVSFRYPGGRTALEDLSVTLKFGEKIAIVGENGAGKSTFVKLLCQFYEPTSGRILVDGIDIREFDVDSWRACISAVFQDFFSYHFTVKEAIALGNPRCLVSPALLKEAAKKGGFETVVSRLSKGYRTRLGIQYGGIELSGGEKQRLAMARAFAREAPILLFDEPTASLDPLTEREIFERVAKEAEGRTTIFVTHRLGSVNMADRIIVMSGGSIVAQGKHDDLLESSSVYSELYLAQAEQFHAHGNLKISRMH